MLSQTIILMGITMIITLTVSAVALNETVRVYDHDVRFTYNVTNLDICIGTKKFFKVQEDAHQDGVYWKWNITDLTGQTVMVVNRTGILPTRFQIERLVVDTTNEFETIYDVYKTDFLHTFAYSFNATKDSGLQDVRGEWNLNFLRYDYDILYRETQEKVGRYQRFGFVTYRGFWLDVTAGQDVVETVAMGMVMEYFINEQEAKKEENENIRF